MATKSESQEQIDFIQWCNRNKSKHYKLDLIFAIPNGGKRHIVTASRMKSEGQKAGVPDLFLPVAIRDKNLETSHGLFIEMKKTKGGVVSKEQKKWRDKLEGEGYRWEVAKGCEQAKAIICDYLDI